jgi:magnesium transporter
MLNRYAITTNKITPDPEGNVYVYFNPNEEEKRYLIENFSIDDHTLSSSLDAEEIARIEFEPTHMAMILKCPKSYSATELYFFRVLSIGTFLFNDKLIIICAQDIPMLFHGKHFQKVTSLTDLLFKLIYRFIFQFYEHLKIINKISDELEEKINEAMGNKYLLNLFSLEKSLVYYLNAISSNGILMEKIKTYSSKININVEDSELLDDIIIENSQCLKQADIYSNILASMMDARVSIVSNNLNILMKTLNIITILIMVPTFVVSAFSMNVELPFSLKDHPLAFWLIMGMAVVSIICIMLIWKYKKW